MHPSSRRGGKSYVEDLSQYVLGVARDERGPVNVMHVHDWHLWRVAEIVREDVGAPIVTTTHLLHNPIFGWWGMKLPAEVIEVEKAACVNADRVITVSHAMASLVAETYGVARERIVAVHNGLDPASIETFGGAHSGEPSSLVVYAGRIVLQKGVAALLHSAPIVLDAVPNARWVLAGPAGEPFPGRRDLQAELRAFVATDPRLGRAITFTGQIARAELAELYRSAALAVVPSVYEPFGYAALEAMCSALPVVATDIGGLPEIVEAGRTGLLVPLAVAGDERAPDVAELARAQIELLRDPSRARAMGDAGRTRALSAFPPGRMAEETEAVYRALMR
jgi:glycosyltransferase involved in cell wall biosynthesis